jgi:DNA-directed RNA polymerase subunit F
MATSTQTPSVDVGALTAAMREDVTDRLSTILVAGFEALEEDGRGLDQLQRSDLTRWAFDSFDGLERAIAQKLVDDLTRNEIEVLGLSTSLADLMPRNPDDA